MPELEALAPLRALLVSIARPDEATVWSSSGPYLTLGKRGVHPDELRRRMPQAFHRITEHLQVLFKARSEEHTSELQSRLHLVCRLLLEKKKNTYNKKDNQQHD